MNSGASESASTIRSGFTISFAWLANATPVQKTTMLAASLGWMLDAMDVMLYAMVVPQIQRELHLSGSTAGLIMSVTLISAAIGGTWFGRLADKIGRARALSISILVYCMFTALCAFVHTPLQLAACRTLLGFGMGGEWAAGAVLVAETWPDRHRAKALALVQSAWAIGYALSAGLVAIVVPRHGWRAVFLFGLLPALAAAWIRRRTPEPEIWKREASQAIGFQKLFRGELGRNTLISAAMNSAALFAYWGLFFWIPGYLSKSAAAGGRGLSVTQTSAWTILIQVGGFIGYVSFGFFAERFGAKRAYMTFLAASAVMVPLYLYSSTLALLIIGPVTGFWAMGQFSGFGTIASELFPTSVRGAALGFTYNIGRLTSAAAPFLVGGISQTHDMRLALLLTSLAFLLAAAVAAALPQSRGIALITSAVPN